CLDRDGRRHARARDADHDPAPVGRSDRDPDRAGWAGRGGVRGLAERRPPATNRPQSHVGGDSPSLGGARGAELPRRPRRHRRRRRRLSLAAGRPLLLHRRSPGAGARRARRATGPRPACLILGGLCAGAHWALRIAQEDSRVCAVAVLNPGYLVYDGGLSNAIGQSRSLAAMLLKPSTWSRVVRGQVTPSAHLASLRTLL